MVHLVAARAQRGDRPECLRGSGRTGGRAPDRRRCLDRADNLPGADGTDFSDSPQYIDPTSGFSNSGAGDRWVAGRMTSLATAPDGTVFAGAADGGVWKSTDHGGHWTPTTDDQATLSIGALLVTGRRPGGYTVYAGTGEANTSSDSYAGVGVIASTDGGATWHRVGGPELNGAAHLPACAEWQHLCSPPPRTGSTASTRVEHELGGGAAACRTARRREELQPRRRQHDHRRNGASWDQRSADSRRRRMARRMSQPTACTSRMTAARTSPTSRTRMAGSRPRQRDERRWRTPPVATRRTPIVQSPQLLNVGTNGHTLLQGVYASNNGDPAGPWTKIAHGEQAGRERFRAVHPAHRQGVPARASRPGTTSSLRWTRPTTTTSTWVWKKSTRRRTAAQDGRPIGPYWNFGFTCFSSRPFEGTCDHNQTHSDQHAATISGGTLYVGNDGGVYSRALTNHQVGRLDEPQRPHGRLAVLRRSGQRGLHHLRRYAGQREQQGLHHDRRRCPTIRTTRSRSARSRSLAATAATRSSTRPTRTTSSPNTPGSPH